MKKEEIIRLKETFRNKQTSAYQQLKKDLLFPKIPLAFQKEMLEFSLKKGEKAFYLVKEKYGVEVLKICEKLNVKLFLESGKNKIGNLIFLSRYEKNPPSIIIYEKSLRFLNKFSEFSECNILNIAIAHEIFHHLEETEIGKTYSNYKIKFWSIGNFSFNVYPTVLSEIAANNFSQLLNSIPFSPYIFNCILENAF
jgi:hypothetical protein